MLGRTISNKYELVRQLGAGGTSTVYEAQGPGGLVAIKLLDVQHLERSDVVTRFEREAKAATLRAAGGGWVWSTDDQMPALPPAVPRRT